MPLLTFPPMPGFSKFLLAASIFILIFGLCGYAFARRKEIQKEKMRKAQSHN